MYFNDIRFKVTFPAKLELEIFLWLHAKSFPLGDPYEISKLKLKA